MPEPKPASRHSELAYRFLLWFWVSFGLHYLASISDSRGGQRFAAAMRKPPNDDYALVVFGFALLLFVVALAMKDVHHLIRGISVVGRLFAQLVALVGRVSADLLMSIYAMGSFVVGWMVFDGYRRFQDSFIPDSRVQVLGMDLYHFFALVMAIGMLSVIVRVDEEHVLVRAWYRSRFIWRLLAYLTFLLGLYQAFWVNTDTFGMLRLRG